MFERNYLSYQQYLLYIRLYIYTDSVHYTDVSGEVSITH